MFLKRIETIGFKSFADRTAIQFVPGITAVVGPNGSGKSNVIDAVRWVLGEQSAKSLRGYRMEDIIFQGSDSRKAQNFAEVTLVLDNETQKLPIEYQEVSITRRVYRSGESEFYLNKQPCRLKDIVHLFMDTGLGRESFSIIGQGKVEEILSSKADERRAIFEEAAGVLKYKQRKKEAEIKLEDTANNLHRVEDIIHEIEGQIEPLKEQAEVAKIYNERKKQLQNKEVALLQTEITQFHEQWQEILKTIDKEKQDEFDEQLIVQKKEMAITNVRQQLVTIEQELENCQQKKLELTEMIEQQEGKRNVLEERSKHAQENRSNLEEQKEILVNKVEGIEKTIQDENDQIYKVEEQLKKIHDQIEGLQEGNEQQLIEQEEKIESYKADYIELLNEQAALRNEINTLDNQLKHIHNRIEQQENASKQFKDEKEQLDNDVEQIEAELQEQNDKINELQNQLKKLENKKLSLEEKYSTMQHRLYEGNEHIAKLVSRKEMLEEMKNSYQGFFYGVKEIIQATQKKQIEPIIGTVVDLMEVPSAYITAIDTILGAQAQYIVVQHDNQARNIIQWLKQNNKGRATFLPLQSIEARIIPHAIRKEIESIDGFIGVAAELIHMEDTYQLVANHLMGNVLLAKDLKAASHIATKTKRRFRIVTLEGDVVNPGGSMSGGAKKQQNVNLFTRENEIKTLKTKIADFTKRRDVFVKEMEVIQEEMEQINIRSKALNDEMGSNKIQQTSLQERLQEAQYKRNKTEDQMINYQFYINQFEKEKQDISKHIEQTNRQLKNIEKELEQIDSLIKESTNKWQDMKNVEASKDKQLNQLEKKEIEWKEKLHYFHQRKNDAMAEKEMATNQMNEIMEAIQEQEEIETYAQQASTLHEQIEKWKLERSNLDITMEKDRQKRSDLQKWLEDEQHEIKGLQQVHQEKLQYIQKLEVEANRLDVSLENKLEVLQTEYVMTYDYAKEHYETVHNIALAKEEVEKIKTEIKQLGNVNLGAIEEYDRISERYTFLLDQQKDLIEAKDTLYRVIREMDEEMSTRFESVFTQIQAAFAEVFKRLFGGGHAALNLTDPNNMLETGIDIVAQPPGKKLQSLDLLSGGERSLTAIALLFAILQTKPVPFVILDEVDAALDEANVARFSQYLRSYSDDTQFIVITHRNGTMEEADVLYGVTMQESGVSKLVSVKLEEVMN